ncbi:hypothetical protein CR513_37206, partial [Mucuna pruriens]
MEMSNLASKLKSLELELGEDLLVYLVLVSLFAYFAQFKVSYNTQKEKWSLNELISHCVQREEGLQRDKTENVHFASTSQNKKRKNLKGVVETLCTVPTLKKWINVVKYEMKSMQYNDIWDLIELPKDTKRLLSRYPKVVTRELY